MNFHSTGNINIGYPSLLPWIEPSPDAVPGRDVVLMAEVAEEASYVRHNRHKIALIFSAMRHFAADLHEQGFEVRYFAYGDGIKSLEAAVSRALPWISMRRPGR